VRLLVLRKEDVLPEPVWKCCSRPWIENTINVEQEKRPIHTIDTLQASSGLTPGLRLPDFDRVERIGEFWSYPQSRTFAELLIDLEEDRTLKAVIRGLLREIERG
jgi:hypothetical protein